MMSKTYGDKPLVFAFDGDGEEYMIGSEVHSCLHDSHSASKNSPSPLLRWATTYAFSVEPCTRSSPAWPEGTWPTMRGASSSTWVTLRLVFATNDSNVKNCNFLFAARHLLDNISTAGKGGRGPACWKVNSWWQASFKAFGWKSNLKTILKLSHRDDQFKGNAGNSDTPKLDKPKVTRSFNCEYYESFNPC